MMTHYMYLQSRSSVKACCFLTGIILFMFSSTGYGQTPSGEDILKAIDANTIAGNRIATTTMTIHGRRTSRTLTAKSWIQGADRSFTEYLAPAREKGTKMLKIGDQLWLYSPQSDRVIRIAGHMLRQSLMGSDLSYEDMMEDQRLVDMYNAEVLGSEPINDRDCWVLYLTAKNDDVAYHSRKIWVDKERLIPLREDRNAKSGKLLKTTSIEEVFQVDGRWYPKKMTFKDALSKGKGTKFTIDEIAFDVDIPDHIFSKASLRK